MTIADEARDNALHCEMVKYAYRQTKDGVVVSFVVHPNDIPAALSTSHIGARYLVALVEIDDNEQPKLLAPAKLIPPSGEKRNWRDLPPPQQAGIRCDEPSFGIYLKETYPDDWHESQDAAACVRLICAVHSRAELGTNQKARVMWHQLDQQYQAWLALENA
jgi:hypothetical protein